MRASGFFLTATLAIAGARAAESLSGTAGMKLVPAGSYASFYKSKSKTTSKKEAERIAVAAFWMDEHPVTNREFLGFVKAVPEWRKSKIKSIFTDGHYLGKWRSDLDFRSAGGPNSPVTQVTWFAAEAYCEWKGKSLPTVDQWEYAAADGGKDPEGLKRRILEWYSRPNSKTPPPVGRSPKNGYGLFDLHGLVWEWTRDFNEFVQGAESREKGAGDRNLFCGGGSADAVDATDYAAFMRYSFRNSLKGNYAVENLGFRCVKDTTDVE